MKNRVPISELPKVADVDFETLENRPLMTWNVELPSILKTDRMTVDMNHLNLIHKIGALSTTYVRSEQGEQSEFETQINGAYLGDTATMIGKEVRVSRAQKQRSEVGDLDGPGGKELLKNYGKTSTVHILNKSELVRLVSDERYETHVPSEQAWANQLDSALQASIRGAARKHLMGRLTKMELGAELGQWGVMAGFIMGTLLQGSASENLGEFVTLSLLNRAMFFGYDSARALQMTGNHMMKDRRLSLFHDMQPDRYVALDALTRVRRLIRYEK